MTAPIAANQMWSAREIAGYFAMMEALSPDIAAQIAELRGAFGAYFRVQAGPAALLYQAEIEAMMKSALHLRPDLYDAGAALCQCLGVRTPAHEGW